MDYDKLKKLEAERQKKGYVRVADPYPKQSLSQKLTQDVSKGQEPVVNQPESDGFFGDIGTALHHGSTSLGGSTLSMLSEAANQYFADPLGATAEYALGTVTSPVTIAMDVGNWITDVTGLGDSKGMRKIRKYLETPDIDVMKLYDTDKSFFRDASKDLIKYAEKESAKIPNTWGGALGQGVASIIPVVLTAIATKSPKATMAVGGAMMGGESFLENKDLEMEERLREAVPYIAVGGALESLSGVKVAEKLKGAKPKFAKYFKGSKQVEKTAENIIKNADNPGVVNRLTNRFNKAVFGTYDKAFKNFIKDGTIEGATELTQDIILTSQRWDRMSEREQKEYLDSMPDNMWKTFAVSFLLGGGTSVVTGKGGKTRPEGTTPTTEPQTTANPETGATTKPLYATPPANIDTTNMSEEEQADLQARAEAVKSTVEAEIKALKPDADMAKYQNAVDGYVNSALSEQASLEDISNDIKQNIDVLENYAPEIATVEPAETEAQPTEMEAQPTEMEALTQEAVNKREEIAEIKSKIKDLESLPTGTKRTGLRGLKESLKNAENSLAEINGKLTDLQMADRKQSAKPVILEQTAKPAIEERYAKLNAEIESLQKELENTKSQKTKAEIQNDIDKLKNEQRAVKVEKLRELGNDVKAFSEWESGLTQKPTETEVQPTGTEPTETEVQPKQEEESNERDTGTSPIGSSTGQAGVVSAAPVSPAEQETKQEKRKTTVLKPEEERAKGERTVGGIVYKRQQKDSSKAGVKGKVAFATKEQPVEFEYRIVEAGSLQASHTDSGANPMHFISEGQPKERDGIDSRSARNNIANDPNFEGLGASYDAYHGAPIVNERLEVVQGNNRAAGIKLGYDKAGKTYTYKSQLAADAQKFGFTKEEVEAMDNPVLVRVVKVEDAKAITLGNYTVKDIETGGGERLTPFETANKMSAEDKASLSDLLFANEDQTLNEAIRENFADVVKIVSKYASATQVQSLMDRKGNPTIDALRDISTMTESFLYGRDRTVRGKFELLPAVLQNGIRKSLGAILKTEKGKSIIEELRDAITIIAGLDKAANSFDTYVNQYDLVEGDTIADKYSDETLNIAEALSKAKTQADVARLLKGYAEVVSFQEADLMSEGGEGLSKSDGIAKIFGHKQYIQVNNATVQTKQADKAFNEGMKTEGDTVKKIVDDFNKEAFGGGEVKASFLGLENIIPLAKAVGRLIKLGYNRGKILSTFKDIGVTLSRDVKQWIAKKFREIKQGVANRVSNFKNSTSKPADAKTVQDRLTHKGDLGYITKKAFMTLSNRLHNLDPKLTVMFRKQYMNTLVKTSRRFNKVKGFYESLNFLEGFGSQMPAVQKLNKEYSIWLGKKALDKNGNPTREAELLRIENELQQYLGQTDETLTESRKKAFEVIEELARDLTATGNLKRVLPDHFPRRVKDFKGLRNYLDRLAGKNPAQSEIIALFTKEATDAQGNKVKYIDEAAVASYLRGFKPDGIILSAKQLEDRKVSFEALSAVMDDIIEFYEPPHIALHRYITQMTELAEISRFIKPSTKLNNVTMKSTDAAPAWLATGNFDNIVNYVIEQAINDGTIKNLNQVQELREILSARFDPKYFKSITAKSISQFTAGATLGQLTTSVKNVNDLAMLHYTGYDITNSGITADDLGVDADTYADILGGEKTWKWVRGALAPMKKVETMTNQKLIHASANTSYLTAQKMLSGEQLSDREQKVKEYIETIVGKGDLNAALRGMIKDHEALMAYNELSEQQKANTEKPNPNYITAEVAFNMLMDIKPLGYLEMPEAYAKHPSSRFIYALKSYRLRQLNYLYKESIQLMKNKNTFGRGLRNMLRYNTSLMAFKVPTTILVNLMLGADWDEGLEYIQEFLSGKISDGLLSMGYSQSSEVIGINRYNVEKFQDNPIEAVSTFLVPAAGLAYGLGKDATSPKKLTKRVPFVGNVVYQNWLKEKKSERGRTRRERTRRER